MFLVITVFCINVIITVWHGSGMRALDSPLTRMSLSAEGKEVRDAKNAGQEEGANGVWEHTGQRVYMCEYACLCSGGDVTCAGMHVCVWLEK